MSDLIAKMVEIAESEGSGPDAKERCGIIVKEGRRAALLELDNVHETPLEFFRMRDADVNPYVVANTLLGFWHTHPRTPAAPSDADRRMIEAWRLPMHIVTPYGGHTYNEPVGWVQPYEGRVFVHGAVDCYTMIQDYFSREEGIMLDDFPRDDEWWLKGQNLYEEHFESQGFVKIPGDVLEHTFEKGDVLIIQVESDVPNHGAIYVGDGIILHHVFKRLSERTIFGGYWHKNLALHLRHKSKL